MNNYSYPIISDWSQSELITMMNLYTSVEDAYENSNGVSTQKIMDLYDKFKKINPSKMEQKRIDREFLNISGYSLYKTWVASKRSKFKNIKMSY
jgi:uncharacterized protein YktA (UPF0223 family)